MKFYYCPGACSIGIHVVLEEIGKPYDAVPVALMEGAQYKPDYTAITPKSKVPALTRDDGSTVTEYAAIATWLAKSNPSSKLFPGDLEKEIRALEAIDYCVGTIHAAGFTRMFRPVNFASNEAEHEAIKQRGHDIVTQGYEIMDRALAGKDYVVGDYSIADSALFYVEFWSGFFGLTLPPNLAAHLGRMMGRPAVQRVLKAEGLDQAKAS